jgi:hypothetical protein
LNGSTGNTKGSSTVRGDQKTTVGASSKETSPENDVEVEIEKGTYILDVEGGNPHLDVLRQKGARSEVSLPHVRRKNAAEIVNFKDRWSLDISYLV